MASLLGIFLKRQPVSERGTPAWTRGHARVLRADWPRDTGPFSLAGCREGSRWVSPNWHSAGGIGARFEPRDGPFTAVGSEVTCPRATQPGPVPTQPRTGSSSAEGTCFVLRRGFAISPVLSAPSRRAVVTTQRKCGPGGRTGEKTTAQVPGVVAVAGTPTRCPRLVPFTFTVISRGKKRRPREVRSLAKGHGSCRWREGPEPRQDGAGMRTPHPPGGPCLGVRAQCLPAFSLCGPSGLKGRSVFQDPGLEVVFGVCSQGAGARSGAGGSRFWRTTGSHQHTTRLLPHTGVTGTSPT